MILFVVSGCKANGCEFTREGRMCECAKFWRFLNVTYHVAFYRRLNMLFSRAGLSVEKMPHRALECKS